MISAKTMIACMLGFTAGAALPSALDIDMTSLPPEPAAMHAKLSTCKVNLAAAVSKATAASMGVVRSAMVNDAGNIEVELFSPTERREVVINGQTGDVVSNEVRNYVLPGAPVDGTPVTTPSGLMYYDLVVGEGEMPLETSTVEVHYTGWTLDGNKFDSSVDRGAPATFPLNGVIKGWTEGVGSMKPGGKRKLVIPGSLGYGERGQPRAGIPPNGMLIFDVELIQIVRR